MMTPNNILNMAMLKKLDFVAITDHNTAKQLKTIREIEEAYDFIVVPGIEVTVSEGFDALCYFRTYEDAWECDKWIEQHLVEDDWGPFSENDQIIMDIFDIEMEFYPKSLRQTTISYIELYEFVHALDGRVVLAHIERNSKSALLYYTLDDIPFDGIEIQHYQKQAFLEAHPEIQQWPILTNSDSHSILTLSEREEERNLPEKSIEALFEFLKGRE